MEKLRCIIVDDEEFAREVIKDLVEQTDVFELVKSCPSAMDAYNVLTTEKIDVVFLDIKMPGMSGLELLKNLRKKPVVILVTGKKEYAVESYEYDVADYLMKPVEPGRFLKAVSKAQELCAEKNKKSGRLLVKSEGALLAIEHDDILWAETMDNYVVIHTSGGKHTVLMPMKELEEKLPAGDFMRVHRFYLLNITKVKKVEDRMAVMDDKAVPIGKSQYEEFTQRLERL